jgi:hypothetical protein
MFGSLQCYTVGGDLIAHYNLKPPETRAYGVSGNTLTIHEFFSPLAIGEASRSHPRTPW